MQGVRRPSFGHNGSLQVRFLKSDGLTGRNNQPGHRKKIFVLSAYSLGGKGQFILHHVGGHKVKPALPDLQKKLLAGPVDSRIKYPAINGVIGINGDGHRRYHATSGRVPPVWLRQNAPATAFAGY